MPSERNDPGTEDMSNRLHRRFALASLCASAALAGPAGAESAAPYSTDARVGRTIGYVVTSRQLAVNVVNDPVGAKTDCPAGTNDGPRQQFAKLHPDAGKRSVLDVLRREAQVWFPGQNPDAASAPALGPYHEPQGTIANGMNLDGKVKPTDFTSPAGEPGIDNQVYRAVGCIGFFRRPDGVNYYAVPLKLMPLHWNRSLIEITEVDSLSDDPAVTVHFYQGMDGLIRNAKGEPAPRGSIRINERWGKGFQFAVPGKIVGGVLTTEPIDLRLPDTNGHGEFTEQMMRGARLRLKLGSEKAEGLMAGYMDVDTMYYALARSWDTAHTSYGDLALQSYYAAVARHADGYPDATGRFTAISGAWEMKLVQSYVIHPDAQASVAMNDKQR